MKARGNPVTTSVRTPDAQQLENAIPNPNNNPPNISPKLIGLTHKSYSVGSCPIKKQTLTIAVPTNNIINILINFVDPVL